MEVSRFTIITIFFIINFIVLDKIAFNSGGSIFFNLRYYEQVFANQIDSLSTTSSHPIIIKLVNFYFVLWNYDLEKTNFLKDFLYQLIYKILIK